MSYRIIFKFWLLFGIIPVFSQQNHNLFFLHQVPESNLLNPAIPISCKWYIGIPVLSSVHFNYANSSFAFNQIFQKSPDNYYNADVDGLIKRTHRRNFIGTEAHIQLAALGYRTGDYSFMFTITEKNNIPITYPGDVILLALGGNTQFEGQQAGFRGTGVYFNHYREYALSVSKYTNNGLYIGTRAKLLFGKLNIAPRSTDISLHTEENGFILNFDGDMLVHSSLPVIIDTSDGIIENISYNDNITPLQLALNRKNPGFGLDFGLIYPLNEKVEFSASVIDLGFIRWKSNLNTISGSGNFNYDGPLGDSIDSEDYFSDLLNTFIDSLEVETSNQNYTSVLPTRLIAGATLQYTGKLKFGLKGEALLYRSKILPSLSLNTLYNPVGNLHLLASYTLQYNSLANFGLGFVIGRDPVQFYILSDNVPGTIWPLSGRNINLRFGLNVNFGCKIKDKKSPSGRVGSGKGQLNGNCYWAEKQIQKHIKKKKKKSAKK
jgi:hypothetical protein